MLNKYFFIALITFSLVVTFYFIKSSIELYSAKKGLFTAEETLQKLKKEREELKAEIEYRNTEEFVINSARQNLNYSFDGEVTYVVPKDLSIDAAPTPELGLSAEAREGDEAQGNTKITTSTPHINNLYMWFKAFF